MSVGAAGNGRRRVVEEAHVDERWLLTYSDMITLLMALFIVLWSISSVNISKFDQLKVSLKQAFSGRVMPNNTAFLTGGSAPFEQGGQPISPIVQGNQPAFRIKSIAGSMRDAAAKQESDNLRHLQQVIVDYATAHGFADDVRTTIDERGLVVHLLTDKLLFDSGSGVLRSASYPLLAKIAQLLTHSDIVNQVRVEGNTDDEPIHSAIYPSNWELSTARANAVLEFLLGRRVPPHRLSVAGYGDQHPLEPNATAAGRSANRRVDLVVLRRTFNP